MEDSKTLREIIGENFRNARVKLGLTMRELEELSGVGFSHISAIERGKLNVKIDTLEAVSKALNLELQFCDKPSK